MMTASAFQSFMVLGEPDRGADFTGQSHRFTPLRQRQIGLGIGG